VIASGLERPLFVGDVSAGQAEIAARTSISARRSMKSLFFTVLGLIVKPPSGCRSTHMNTLKTSITSSPVRPNGASASLVPALLDAGLRVIDLAGDFRLPAEAYPEWYGFEHPAPVLLEKAVYGVPELFGAQVAGAELVANPGCYATSAILGLAPLLGEGLIEPGAIRVDGKTGMSGAGKAANESTIYTSTEESIRPYRVPTHQHTPEIERGLELATGVAPPVLFVPHLVPAVRGVLTTGYATLTEGTTTETLTEALTVAYAGRPFVRVLAPGAMADSKRVRGTNVIELQAVADARTGTAVVVGAVDNLVKGAAGQAIQNLNLALGFDEAEGLPTVAVYP